MFEMPVESGRIVILARRRLPKVPMRDACFLSAASAAIPYGRAVLAVAYEKVPGHPGTLAARSFFVGDPDVACRLSQQTEMTLADLFVHAPRMMVADHAFIYQKAKNEMQEGARALRACEGNRRMGTFRADSSDIGCCLRTGWRRCVYHIAEVQGGVAGQIVPIDS